MLDFITMLALLVVMVVGILCAVRASGEAEALRRRADDWEYARQFSTADHLRVEADGKDADMRSFRTVAIAASVCSVIYAICWSFV